MATTIIETLKKIGIEDVITPEIAHILEIDKRIQCEWCGEKKPAEEITYLTAICQQCLNEWYRLPKGRKFKLIQR